MSDTTGRSSALTAEKRAQLTARLRSAAGATQLLAAEPIAVVGIGCRFPGSVDTPDRFWQLLANGVDAICEVPKERWDIQELYDPDPSTPGKMSTRYGGFLGGIDRFDNTFFGVSGREAAYMDPQQRLLLEVAWEALEHAGQSPERLAGSATGVFVGACLCDYATPQFSVPQAITAYTTAGSTMSILANRISYLLDLQGPSVVVDTACSSSLVAIHLACQSLRNRESNVALAGGVNLIIMPVGTIALSKNGMMAADGRCKTFDARADGYVRGEGCGMVVLKRLSDALENNDRVLAVIRGSAINQDGKSAGLTAPNALAQQAVIRRALEQARVLPEQVGYVEAHGTGTSLGDPIEVESLTAVVGQPRADALPCYLGSVKTNIGHLEGAAGIAGLIKTVLALHNKAIPPHLHFRELNPNITLEGTPFVIPTKATPWETGGTSRIAGISGFGFGGTNAHVILEEAPEPKPQVAEGAQRPFHLLALSAKGEGALRQLAGRLAEYLAAHPEVDIADVTYTLGVGRAHHSYRLAVPVATVEQARAALARFAAGETPAGMQVGQSNGTQRPRVAFLFTGQGSQYAGMGQALYQHAPAFRAAFDQCADLLLPHLGADLRTLVFAPPPADGSPSPLDQTQLTQPALFALEYALAAFWRALGLAPNALLGHSVGEYVAATLAGVFPLADALALLAARARLMGQLPPGGAMAALFEPYELVAQRVEPHAAHLSIAAVNGPTETVIAGTQAAVDAVLAQAHAQGVQVRRLVVSHAFHSPLMQPMLAPFAQAAAQVRYHAPTLPLVSNLSGQLADPTAVATPRYWCEHVRAAVQFAEGVATLDRLGCTLYVEVGPKPALLGMARRCLPDRPHHWLPSLRADRGAWEQLLESVGAWYVAGGTPDWAALDADAPRRRLPLPFYPFQRERFWIDAAEVARQTRHLSGPRTAQTRRGGHPLLDRYISAAAQPGVHLWELDLSADALAYLEDHRVQGEVVLPAAAYVELAHGAAREAFGPGAHQIEQLALVQMLALPEGITRTVQVSLTADEQGLATFQIFSRADGEPWALHAAGSIRPNVTDAAPEAEPLEEIRARCPVAISGSDHYAVLQERGMGFGPTFQGITQALRGEGEVLAQIQLPAEIAGQTGGYLIHPALLDSCFQTFALAGAQSADDAPVYLPAGLGALRLQPGDLSGALWCHARLRPSEDSAGQLVGDLLVRDEGGQVVLEVHGFQLRRLLGGARAPGSDWLYECAWREQERPASTGAAGVWLLLADSGGVAAELAAQLEAQGGTTLLVSPGAGYASPEPGRYQVDPRQPEDFQRLLRDAFGAGKPACRGMIQLWSLDSGTPASLADIERTQERGIIATLHLVQALAQAGWRDAPRLWLVTRGAQATGAGDTPAAEQAPLWGLGRTIALEHSELSCTRVDLSAAPSPLERQGLLAELLSASPEDQIALRDGRRLVARLVRSRLPAASADIRADATYLISGGLGGLGLAVAGWLVEQGARSIVLLGRSTPSDAAQELIAQMQQSGAQVRIERADVAEQAQLQAVLERIGKELPPLRGVIHAAGILDDGTLARLDQQRFSRVLRPKVAGAWHLHTLTDGQKLDFFVLFSSIASLLGSPGQANYAAANAFLDGLAQARRAAGLPATSINWGPWAEVGMAAAQANRGERVASGGIESISPAEGLAVLGRILAGAPALVAVLALNIRQWREYHISASAAPFMSELVQASGTAPAAQRMVRKAIEAAAPTERLALLESYLREQIAEVLRNDQATIGTHTPLTTMGLDSLMTVELRNRFESGLGVSLAATVVWNYPTIGELAPYLLDKLGLPAAEAEPDAAAAPDRAAEEVALVQQLSQQDVQRLLDEELKDLAEFL